MVELEDRMTLLVLGETLPQESCMGNLMMVTVAVAVAAVEAVVLAEEAYLLTAMPKVSLPPGQVKGDISHSPILIRKRMMTKKMVAMVEEKAALRPAEVAKAL